MQGFLLHSTSEENLDDILQLGRLKPSSITDKIGNDYKGSNIFFQLVPEDIKIKSKNVNFYGGEIKLFFKYDILQKYGSKRFRLTKYDREYSKKYKATSIPKYKVWYNTNWCYGSFRDNEEYKKLKFKKPICLSYDYNPSLSVKENIKFFRNKKESQLEGFKRKYKVDRYDVAEHNELVIQARSIPLKDNLLVIYGQFLTKEEIEYYKFNFPEYTFTNDIKEAIKIVKRYYSYR
jgi:hypothetical protein